MSKALDISSGTARLASDLSKALTVLSDTTVRRSAVDQEDLKPYWQSEKRPHFSRWSKILSFTSFSKTLITTERRRQFLAVEIYPTFLNTATTNQTFQQSRKQDSFIHLLKSSANMDESSGSPLEYNQDQTPLINLGTL